MSFPPCGYVGSLTQQQSWLLNCRLYVSVACKKTANWVPEDNVAATALLVDRLYMRWSYRSRIPPPPTAPLTPALFLSPTFLSLFSSLSVCLSPLLPLSSHPLFPLSLSLHLLSASSLPSSLCPLSSSLPLYSLFLDLSPS